LSSYAFDFFGNYAKVDISIIPPFVTHMVTYSNKPVTNDRTKAERHYCQ